MIGLSTFPVSLLSIFVVFQRFVYFCPFYMLPILMDPECSRTTGYQRYYQHSALTVRGARSRPCRSRLGPTARESCPIPRRYTRLYPRRTEAYLRRRARRHTRSRSCSEPQYRRGRRKQSRKATGSEPGDPE